MKLSGVCALLLSTVNANDDDKYPRGGEERITQIATFEISVNGEQLGEVELGLFGGVVPRTVKNFASLCEGWKHPETGKTYSYAGSKIHRISYDFVIQGINVRSKQATCFDSMNVLSLYLLFRRRSDQ